MFIKRDDGKVGFLPFGLLSKFQYILSDEILIKQINKLTNVTYSVMAIIMILLIIDLRLLFLLFLLVIPYYLFLYKLLDNTDKELHRQKYRIKDLFRIAFIDVSISKSPIFWLIGVLSALSFLILIVYILINDILIGHPLDWVFVWFLLFIGVLFVLFLLLFKMSLRNK